jgi:N-methylhydantoinase B
VMPGESIVSISCGGGGYGPPRERDPRRVERDVREGFVTRTRARDVYGVELDSSGSFNVESTRRLRERRT